MTAIGRGLNLRHFPAVNEPSWLLANPAGFQVGCFMMESGI